MKLLCEKPDGFRLSEFNAALSQAYELAIPAAVFQSDEDAQIPGAGPSFETKKNLFDCYHQMDLRCLIGHAIIIPFAHQRAHERAQDCEDDLIKSLHAHHSREFEGCKEDAEKRLERMFQIKNKSNINHTNHYT